MSVKNFKFVSPGVFLNEIDNSILPNAPREIGPLMIGRALRGPAMRPVTVDSFEEFVNLYGEPVPGGAGDDVWRNGNELTPMYGTYAAQAWLKNSPTLTYFRLAGVEHLNKEASVNASAGWKTENLLGNSEDSTGWSAPNAHTQSATPELVDSGGAFGLFVFPQKITGSEAGEKSTTGSLAAVWYVNEGSVGLKGVSTMNVGTITKNYAQGEPIASDSNGNFTVVITGSGTKEEFKFNFNKNDKRFIRKVFNTNPTLVNSTITATDSRKIYWLGETYENTLRNFDVISSSCTSSLPLNATNTYWGILTYMGQIADDGSDHANRKRAFTDPKTGWYFSQDLSANSGSFDPRNMQKLFRFISLGHGEWAQNNIKISIQNIKAPSNNFVSYPTFDVVVRNIADNDKAQQVLEKFSNCDLNPKSPNFIGAKIGTQYYEFNTSSRRLIQKGDFVNKSRYIRVELDSTVEAGTTNQEYVPFGVYGPTTYRDFKVISNTTGIQNIKIVLTSSASPTEQFLTSNTDIETRVWAVAGPLAGGAPRFIEDFQNTIYVTSSHRNLEYSFTFPKAQLRQDTAQDGLSSPAQANFGVWTGESTTSVVFNREIFDLLRPPSSDLSEIHETATTSILDHQYIFSLDDIIETSASKFTYQKGSRRGTTSVTAQSGSWRDLINKGISSFTTVLYGGTDGWDITEKDPLRNTFLDDGGNSETANYAYNTVKQAIDSIKDPEFAEYNLVSIPGITNEGLTRHLIDTVESRADALAVIDLKGDYAPLHESTAASYGYVTTVVENLKNRGLNTSYACAYYPYVQVRDTLTGDLVYMPPSVLAVGAMSYTDKVKAPWFAPAGFNRGGLSSGVAGLPVVGITDKLTSQDRDNLYDANVNPIASFPSEGIVIFGQKTLQVTRSALDRINVRRLLLYVKKGISRISNELLFEPNVQETWDRFISRANPFLADVKARFGLTDYKLVLDKTTTTPDLIDQNIMYAKVFLKPARAIEFIAVDFVITNTGASFED